MEPVLIRPGDSVSIEPGEEHWHGAIPDRLMTDLAMLEVDEEGTSATWGDHVTDDEYTAADGHSKAEISRRTQSCVHPP